LTEISIEILTVITHAVVCLWLADIRRCCH